MTLFIETSNPPQWKPFKFNSETIRRYGWLWFAVGWIKVPFRQFCETAYDWRYSSPSRASRNVVYADRLDGYQRFARTVDKQP